ncbi:unnamed protein product, partial [Effrenium voratum]
CFCDQGFHRCFCCYARSAGHLEAQPRGTSRSGAVFTACSTLVAGGRCQCEIRRPPISWTSARGGPVDRTDRHCGADPGGGVCPLAHELWHHSGVQGRVGGAGGPWGGGWTRRRSIPPGPGGCTRARRARKGLGEQHVAGGSCCSRRCSSSLPGLARSAINGLIDDFIGHSSHADQHQHCRDYEGDARWLEGEGEGPNHQEGAERPWQGPGGHGAHHPNREGLLRGYVSEAGSSSEGAVGLDSSRPTDRAPAAPVAPAAAQTAARGRAALPAPRDLAPRPRRRLRSSEEAEVILDDRGDNEDPIARPRRRLRSSISEEHEVFWSPLPRARPKPQNPLDLELPRRRLRPAEAFGPDMQAIDLETRSAPRADPIEIPDSHATPDARGTPDEAWPQPRARPRPAVVARPRSALSDQEIARMLQLEEAQQAALLPMAPATHRRQSPMDRALNAAMARGGVLAEAVASHEQHLPSGNWRF